MKKLLIVCTLFLVCFITNAQNIGDTLFVDKDITCYKEPDFSSAFLFSSFHLKHGDRVIMLSYYEKFLHIKQIDGDSLWIWKNRGIYPIINGEINYNTYTQSFLEEYKSPGDELIKFKNHYYTGYGLMFGGFAVASTSLFISDNDTKIAMTTIGGAISLIGFIVNLESISHVGKAGLLLNENGIGVKIKL